jgi:hypothetical protein
LHGVLAAADQGVEKGEHAQAGADDHSEDGEGGLCPPSVGLQLTAGQPAAGVTLREQAGRESEELRQRQHHCGRDEGGQEHALGRGVKACRRVDHADAPDAQRGQLADIADNRGSALLAEILRLRLVCR